MTRVYNPLGLTDIVSTRAFNEDGTINIYRVEKHRRDAALRISAQGVETEAATTADTELASKLDTADAIQANCWASRWAEYASDPLAEDWRNWLKRILRETGMGLKAFSHLYQSASGRSAMAMRSGATWGDAVKEMIADGPWLTLHKQRASEVLPRR